MPPLTLWDWLWAIPVFGLIILVHELGHFATAKAFGIRVHEFAVGFGPTIAAVTRGETRYSARLFLVLGGFVRMAGMEDGDTEDPRGFAAKPVWQRFLTIAAGPVMNFILAVLIFTTLIGVKGHPDRPTQVHRVLEGYPAAAAGLQAGDRIVAVNGRPVPYFTALRDHVQGSRGQALRFTVQRGSQTLELTVQPVRAATGGWQVGVEPVHELAYYPASLGVAVSDGFAFTIGVTQELFSALGRWVGGRETPQVAGPVEITRTIARASQEGVDNVAQLAALLSINIGIINLFPFPALDGSRLVFLAVEAVRRRRVNPQRENLIHFVGLVLLLGLMAVITYSELVK